MKIEFDPKSINPPNVQAKKTDPNPMQKSFGQVMADTVRAGTPSTHNKTNPATASSMGVLPLRPMDSGVDSPTVVSKLEQMLDLLDRYRAQLEDTRISLRQMAPLTQDMTVKLKDLAADLEQLDPQDTLAPILSEVLVTASLEVKKFENGWYNPA